MTGLYRQPGRNPKKFYKPFGNAALVLEMVRLASDTIDREIAAAAGPELQDLKDKVFDALYVNLPWWPADCVEYPGFCSYGGKTHGAWACIRKWWVKQHPSMALRPVLDTNSRPGIEEEVWYVITSWDEAMPIIELTLEDNASRLTNNLEEYVGIAPPIGNRAIQIAMQSAPAFIQMQYDLIEAATWFSEVLRTSTGRFWFREDDAIDAVENRLGYRSTETRAVGRSLWAEHLVMYP